MRSITVEAMRWDKSENIIFINCNIDNVRYSEFELISLYSFKENSFEKYEIF